MPALLSPQVISLTGLFTPVEPVLRCDLDLPRRGAGIALWRAAIHGKRRAFGLYLIAMAIGVPAPGFVADATRRHAEVTAAGFGAAAIATFAICSVDLGIALMPAMAAAGFLSGTIMPSRDMMVRAAAPPETTGRVFGIVTTGFNIGGAIGPILVADWRARRRAHGMALVQAE